MFTRDCAETNSTYLQRPHARPPSTAAWHVESEMSFMNGLKKYAIQKLKERRHRDTVTFLDSLPQELKKDIGWTGPNRRYE